MHIDYKENQSPEMTYGILQSYFAVECTYLDLSSLFSFLLYVSTLHKLMISKGNNYNLGMKNRITFVQWNKDNTCISNLIPPTKIIKNT